MDRGQIDRKSAGAKFFISFRFLDGRPRKLFDPAKLFAFRAFKAVKAMNKLSIRGNDIAMGDYVAKFAAVSENADKKVVLAGLSSD